MQRAYGEAKAEVIIRSERHQDAVQVQEISIAFNKTVAAARSQSSCFEPAVRSWSPQAGLDRHRQVLWWQVFVLSASKLESGSI